MLFIIAILAALVAGFVYRNAKRRLNRQETNFALLGLVVAIIIALRQCWTVIPAGHAGGVNFVNPVARVVKFDTRKQELKEVMSVPSKEGLSVELEISMIFRLSTEK